MQNRAQQVKAALLEERVALILKQKLENAAQLNEQQVF
jgi:hypothetical protein